MLEGDSTSDPVEMSATTQNQIKHICWYEKYCSEVTCYSVVFVSVPQFQTDVSHILPRRSFFTSCFDVLPLDPGNKVHGHVLSVNKERWCLNL